MISKECPTEADASSGSGMGSMYATRARVLAGTSWAWAHTWTAISRRLQRAEFIHVGQEPKRVAASDTLDVL